MKTTQFIGTKYVKVIQHIILKGESYRVNFFSFDLTIFKPQSLIFV